MRIPIAKPFFGDEELQAIRLTLESGWIVQGPAVKAFEDKFATFTGVDHAVAASTCTSALHLAVVALGLRPGDEVIVPAFTWVSTANVVEYQGGRPVFCDIDLSTFNIDSKQIEACVTPRTVGIIPVHLFGLCAEMDSIVATAQEHGLWVVEDAACALGSMYGNKHVGTFGEAGCFSLHPRKSITTGEGGMLTTSSGDIARLVRMLRDHGSSRSDFSRHGNDGGFLLPEYKHLGYNYRMTDLQGAMGGVQMDRLAHILQCRQRRARLYDEALKDLNWLATPCVTPGCVHSYQSYVCLFRPEEPSVANAVELNARRNALMVTLEERGISTRQGTHAPVILDYYAKKYDLRPEQFPAAYLADRLSLTLPSYLQMTDAEQDFVVEQLVSAFEEA